MDMKYKAALLAATFAFAAGCADSGTDTPTASSTDYDTTYDTASSVTAEPIQPQSSEIETNDSAMGGAATGERSSANSRSVAQSSNLQQFIDYQVVDQQGQRIGTVESFWENESGQPEFMAIATQGSSDKVHVVPADAAEVNQQRQMVRLKYDAQKVQSAPSVQKDAELNQQQQQQVRTHFGMQSAQGRAAGAQQGSRDQASIQLKEEQLKVGTREVDAGGVILRKVVRTHTVNKPVQVQREELVIERVPGGQEVKGNAQFDNKEIFIPLKREEAVVEKEAIVKETVNVEKETEEEQRQISEQVRSEQLEIIERDAANPQAGSPGQSQSGTERQQQPGQPQPGQQNTPPQE